MAGMPVELKGHAPTARCYSCGAAKIASTCHRCGLAMCEMHGNRLTDPAGKPVSKEFMGLGLDDKHAVPSHCESHAHIVKGSLIRLVYVGLAVAVLGILLALASLIAGLLSILIGAGVAVWAYIENQRREAAAQEARPPLPLIPNVDSVHVVETLHGEVRLGEDGRYTSDADPVAGRIDVAMTLARSDRERLDLYREKYKRGPDHTVEFSAGFCVVQGTAGLIFEPPGESSATPLPSGTGLSFGGDIATHPLFALTEGGAAVRWTASNAYSLHPSRVPDSVPIWLVPSLVPSSGQRTLELDLHWNRLGDKRTPLLLDSFEDIELRIPTRWGNVEGVKPSSAFISPPDQGVRAIRWTPSKADLQGHSLTLTIRFEKEVRQTDKLAGRFRAIFNGTLSGIDGVNLYRPLGDPWLTRPDTTVKTEVAVDFELSLKAIRHQDVRVVPDQNRSEDNDLTEVDEFAVIPDYLTVIELTNMLSDNECYVKRVIENPPRGAGRAGLVNRFWDIAGRHYDGVFPIDFHITVTGEEQYEGGIRAHSGSTAVRLTVQGSYVNREMEGQIEGEWERLHELVTNKLKKLKGRDRAVFQPPADAYRATFQPPTDQSPPAPPPPRLPADDESPNRAAVLRKRLEDLTEAVIAGRIDSQMYRELKADIESELASID